MTYQLHQLLGLTDAPDTNTGWHARVHEGLDVAALKNLAKTLGVTEKKLAELVLGGASVPRKGVLNREASNFLFRIATALSDLVTVARREPAFAVKWLREAQPQLRDRIPLLMLQSHHGADYVYVAIRRI